MSFFLSTWFPYQISRKKYCSLICINLATLCRCGRVNTMGFCVSLFSEISRPEKNRKKVLNWFLQGSEKKSEKKSFQKKMKKMGSKKNLKNSGFGSKRFGRSIFTPGPKKDKKTLNGRGGRLARDTRLRLLESIENPPFRAKSWAFGCRHLRLAFSGDGEPRQYVFRFQKWTFLGLHPKRGPNLVKMGVAEFLGSQPIPPWSFLPFFYFFKKIIFLIFLIFMFSWF
jgi:hypothetical protein